MSKTQELYDLLSSQITGLRLRCQQDIAEMQAKEKDFLMRQHLENVRHARFVIETSDLEAMRIALVHHLTAEQPLGPIIKLDGP